MSLGAHFWTLWPVVRERWRPAAAPPGELVGLPIEDPEVGRIELTGHLRRPAGARRLLLLLHGLGGCADSRYLVGAARAADALGMATLRLNQRGADRRGEDFYHAGLSSDLAAVVASPVLAAFTEVYVLGFSLGGHLALRYATEVEDARVRGVAAICSPLDLACSAVAFDHPLCTPYRLYVLRGLNRIYERVAERRPLAHPPEVVRRIRKLRELDAHTVVPRFGFGTVENYYAQASVGPRLGGLKVRSLLVAAEHDPMVTREAIRPWLADASPLLETRWSRRGGHVSFPGDLDLGLGGERGLEGQVLGWLLEPGPPTSPS